MARPTLRDVAAAAGVHIATASRALNSGTRSKVNDQTAERVIAVAERLGYMPDPVARSLKTARSRSIGLVIPDIANPLFPPIIRGIECRLEADGYDLAIVNTDNDARRERRLIESLLSRKVAGLIIATARREHALLEELHARGLALVLINRDSEGLDVPAITPADADGMRLLVAHLADLGHRRVAFVGGPPTTSTGWRRARAFVDAVREHDLVSRGGWRTSSDSWSIPGGHAAMSELLEDTTPPAFTSVIAANDLLALGCCDALCERGLTPGTDISVAGFNGMDFLDRLAVPLTSVRIPHRALGERAAELLLDLIGRNQVGSATMSAELPVQLIPRASTAPPSPTG
ncbi:LacI family DNA-binding transcriptional regulator [Pseudonocardia spinosispora]|uniref:LacI family DNA-binding transcriptional regulator n=1 Tax=Pseudonocardia spinosispora TaxID=103441 RepID=UPI0003F89292|nr:LacI family DNA-binding transcriptional regulator [Pseudonocardia spinosispora]